MSSRLEQLKKMLEQEPNDEFLQYAIAMEYISAEEIEKAIAALQKILQNNPLYLAAYYQLGKCYELQTEFDKAGDIYTKGIDLAQKLGQKKTLNELREALFLLED